MLTRLSAISLAAAAALSLAAEPVDTVGYSHYRIGSYGEAVAQFKDYGINRFASPDGNSRIHRNSVAIPRFVISGEYKFNPKWILGAEIEFEAGGTGTAVELENSENGEYETEIEKGGEVALEQFHITRLICPAFNVQVGHMIVPLGQTNAHHEPILFFGTTRPESETVFIPSTWHETGIQFFGSFGKHAARFSYQAMIVAGLNANGFDRDSWIASGKQGFFETDNFTSPGYVARLDWNGIKGLRLGVSGYYCRDAGSNSDKPHIYSSIGRIPVTIGSMDASYSNRYLALRANVIYGHLGNAAGVSSINRTLLSGKSPYNRTSPVAKNALSYGAEIGAKLDGIIGRGCPAIVPFARYDYFDPQEAGMPGQTMDKRLQVSRWTVGLNWFPLPNLVVKADYATRQIGTSKVFGKGKYTSENEFSIGIAYATWFFSK
ncbi:MAG: OprO/OprP family phosphate-selective porin [Pseudoflavonifractor sp.]|nr:OprO/OprP family phosphate-selective porin [Alloprevotella sp.]MCM1116892.1 OprO/OprP family phosphate-selective porin [Pseudoflavonifractor sp.]